MNVLQHFLLDVGDDHALSPVQLGLLAADAAVVHRASQANREFIKLFSLSNFRLYSNSRRRGPSLSLEI